ncbi:MAG TPA: sugar ABC transporter permease [Chthoniobacterales bacterium]
MTQPEKDGLPWWASASTHRPPARGGASYDDARTAENKPATVKRVTSAPAGARGVTDSRRARRDRRAASWFIFPAAFVLTVVTLAPLAYSLFVSFTNWTLTVPGSDQQFIGLANYGRVLASPAFWKTVQVTMTFALSATGLELLLSVAFALMLNQQFVGRGLIRALVLIPLVITPAVVGMFWKLLYDDQQGVFNFFLVSSGLPRIHWLDQSWALTSVVLTDVWQWTPFLVLIVLAGLHSLDVEMLEAARIDGANRYQTFRYLTLPHLIPYLMVGVFFRLLDAMKDFDKIYLLTQGGPGSETSTFSIYAFDTGFRIFQIGRTSAIAWLIALVSFVVSLPLLWVMSRRISREMPS